MPGTPFLRRGRAAPESPGGRAVATGPGLMAAPPGAGGWASSRLLLPALAAVLFAALSLAVVLGRPLLPVDETRYLAVAWEMRRDGTWLVPHLNGALYGQKPPLLFWLVNLAWTVAGVGDLAARLVAPSFGVAAVALTGWLSLRLWPAEPRRAGLAALMLATAGTFLVLATATMFDALLTAAVLAAVLALLALRRSQGWGPVLALGAALAFGVLAKGPVVLVHVAPPALLMPLWADAASRPRFGPWLGRLAAAVLVALGLVLLWLGPALVLGGPEYRTEVLWRQSAGRVVTAFAHERPPWFFLTLVPLYLWPWGWTREGLRALAPRAVWGDEPSRLLAVWIGGAFVAFSLISGKQAHYLLPEMPALALLLAGAGPPRGRPRWALLPVLLPAAALLAVAAGVALGAIPDLPVNGATVGGPRLAGAAAVLAAAALALLAPRRAWLGVALAAPATVSVLLVAGGPLLRGGYDPAPLGQLLKANEAAGLALADGTYHGQFTWAGRLRRPVDLIRAPQEVAPWAAAHPGGLLLSPEDLAAPGLDLTGIRQFHGEDYRIYVARRDAP